MEIIDRDLGWLGRVLLTAGLIVGVVIPPMLLKLINQLYRQHQLTAWQISLADHPGRCLSVNFCDPSTGGNRPNAALYRQLSIRKLTIP